MGVTQGQTPAAGRHPGIVDGDSNANKATELFDKYKPGEKGKDTGLLYLLSVEDRKDRLEVGYGLESVIPDADAADIIDTAHSDYKDGDWSKGVNKVVDGIETSIEERFPHEIPDGATEEGTGRWHHDRRHAHRVLSRKLHSRVP